MAKYTEEKSEKGLNILSSKLRKVDEPPLPDKFREATDKATDAHDSEDYGISIEVSKRLRGALQTEEDEEAERLVNEALAAEKGRKLLDANIIALIAFIIGAIASFLVFGVSFFLAIGLLIVFIMVFSIWRWRSGYRISSQTRLSINELLYVVTAWGFFLVVIAFLGPITFWGLFTIIQVSIDLVYFIPLIVVSILFAGRWVWVNLPKFVKTSILYIWHWIRGEIILIEMEEGGSSGFWKIGF